MRGEKISNGRCLNRMMTGVRSKQVPSIQRIGKRRQRELRKIYRLGEYSSCAPTWVRIPGSTETCGGRLRHC